MSTTTLGDLWDEAEVSGKAKMTLLCESFPSLRGVPGTNPWNQMKFAKWGSGPAPTHGSRLAATFVLSVWNGGTPDDGGWWNEGKFHVGRFDVVEAFAVWDSQHQAAFKRWCDAPFWP